MAFEPTLLARINKPVSHLLEGYRAVRCYAPFSTALPAHKPPDAVLQVKPSVQCGRPGARCPRPLASAPRRGPGVPWLAHTSAALSGARLTGEVVAAVAPFAVGGTSDR